jgi:ribose-phosphate pyrophosphokinase
MFVIGEEEIKDKHCILIDDLTATCGTLNSASDLLKEKGAKSVRAVVSHCCLNDRGHDNLLNGSLDQLITTDTIPVRKNSKIKVLSVSDLLVAAITRTEDGRSIADLFRYKPNEFKEYDYDEE